MGVDKKRKGKYDNKNYKKRKVMRKRSTYYPLTERIIRDNLGERLFIRKGYGR